MLESLYIMKHLSAKILIDMKNETDIRYSLSVHALECLLTSTSVERLFSHSDGKGRVKAE